MIFEQPSKQVPGTHDVQDQDSYKLASPQDYKCRLTNEELSKKPSVHKLALIQFQLFW